MAAMAEPYRGPTSASMRSTRIFTPVVAGTRPQVLDALHIFLYDDVNAKHQQIAGSAQAGVFDEQRRLRG
jgi:hypothetical protein